MRHGWQQRAACALVMVMVALASTQALAQNASLKELISTKTLDNGLDVIVIEDSAVPLVTIEIAVKNGAFTEPPEFNGLSHLYEHMFFKGNAKIPDQTAYLERIRELGIVFNGTTSTERVNYYFTLPADNVDAGLKFMFDAITSPKFDEKEFKNEIKVVIGEVDRNESNPYYWFGQAVDQLLWYKHPTRKDSLGDRNTITSSTTAKMRTMQKRYYLPNNSALLISGDIKAEKAFALAEKHFKTWKKGPDPHVKYPVPEHPPLPSTTWEIVEKPVQVPVFQFAFHGPSVAKDPAATFAADVLSYIVGQPTSRFQKALVQSGLTLQAGVSYFTQRYTGPISVSAAVQPAKAKEAIVAVLAEVYKLADEDYFTDAQLDAAKTILTVESIYERETPSSLTHTVSFWWAVAGIDYYLNYIDNLNKVTRAGIARYVKTYIIDKPYVFGMILSSDARQKLGLDDKALGELLKQAERQAKTKP